MNLLGFEQSVGEKLGLEMLGNFTICSLFIIGGGVFIGVGGECVSWRQDFHD